MEMDEGQRAQILPVLLGVYSLWLSSRFSDSSSSDPSSSGSDFEDNLRTEAEQEAEMYHVWFVLSSLYEDEWQQLQSQLDGSLWGGSLVGKKPNVERDHLGAFQQLLQDYLLDDRSTYSEAQFRRRFRMSSS